MDRSSRSGRHICSGVQGSKQSQGRSRKGVDAGTSLQGTRLAPDMHWALDGGSSLVPRSYLQLLLGLVGILLEHLAAQLELCPPLRNLPVLGAEGLLPAGDEFSPSFLKKILFIYFGCAGSSLLHGFSLVVSSGGCSLVVVCGFLIAVASLVVEQGL